MTLDIVGVPSKREIDYTSTPTPELLQEAEQYIFDLIDGGLDAYKEKVAKWETNKRFHLYFGYTKNEELVKMRNEFMAPIKVEVQKQKELDIKKEFDQNIAKAKERWDTYEGKYDIMTDNWTWICIGMEKPSKQDKGSFGYTMIVDKNETPQFYQYCKDNLSHYRPH